MDLSLSRERPSRATIPDRRKLAKHESLSGPALRTAARRLQRKVGQAVAHADWYEQLNRAVADVQLRVRAERPE